MPGLLPSYEPSASRLPINGVFAVASDAIEVVYEADTCVMVDVVVKNLWMRDGSAGVHVVVIWDDLLSSGCRRGYKGVERCTSLVWALSLRGLV